MFVSRLVSNQRKANGFHLMLSLQGKSFQHPHSFTFRIQMGSCLDMYFKLANVSSKCLCHSKVHPLPPDNDFSAVVVHAPSDLHFLCVWCTWVKEGHYNGSLWRGSCAWPSLWARGAASYAVVRIANDGSRVTECVLYYSSQYVMSSHRMISRLKEVA